VDWHVLRREGVGADCFGPFHEVPLYLGHAFRTDLLLLRLRICPPLGYNPRSPWLHDAFRTAAEAVSLAASLRLDIDPGELSAGYRLTPPAATEVAGVLAKVDLYLFDTASGGAGYAAEVGDVLPEVFATALELLHGCSEGCDRSCTRCLRHYGNRYWHERLDRKLAAQLIAYAGQGRIPQVAPHRIQMEQLTALRRYLELEGWTIEPTSRIDDIDVPLVVRGGAELDRRRLVVVGTYPALLDRAGPSFSHPLLMLREGPERTVVLLNDYVVAPDLPTAYHALLKEALRR
jgi:hypothetical protein